MNFVFITLYDISITAKFAKFFAKNAKDFIVVKQLRVLGVILCVLCGFEK